MGEPGSTGRHGASSNSSGLTVRPVASAMPRCRHTANCSSGVRSSAAKARNRRPNSVGFGSPFFRSFSIKIACNAAPRVICRPFTSATPLRPGDRRNSFARPRSQGSFAAAATRRFPCRQRSENPSGKAPGKTRPRRPFRVFFAQHGQLGVVGLNFGHDSRAVQVLVHRLDHGDRCRRPAGARGARHGDGNCRENSPCHLLLSFRANLNEF